MAEFGVIVAGIMHSRDNGLATINGAGTHGVGGYLRGDGVVRDTPANGFSSVDEALEHVQQQRSGNAGIIGVLDRSGAVPETRFFPSPVHGKYFLSAQLMLPGYTRDAGLAELRQFGGKLSSSVAAIGSSPGNPYLNPAFVPAGTPMRTATKLKIAGTVGALAGAAIIGARVWNDQRAS